MEKKLRTNKRRRPNGPLCSMCMSPIDLVALRNMWANDQDYLHSCGRRIPPYKEPRPESP